MVFARYPPQDLKFGIILLYCLIYYGLVVKDKSDKNIALKNINDLITDVNSNIASDTYENNQEIKKFESLTELNESFSFWVKKFNIETEQDKKIAVNILSVQKKLSETEPTKIFNLQITNVTL